MRKVHPFFSVLIVNYNAGDLLQSAINSLKNQTFRDFELVIVDNDSSGSSADGIWILKGLPKRFAYYAKNKITALPEGNNLGARENGDRENGSLC